VPAGSLRSSHYRRGSRIRRSLFWPPRAGACRVRALHHGSCRAFPEVRSKRGWEADGAILTILWHSSSSHTCVGNCLEYCDVGSLGVANVDRFQSLYMRANQWLESHEIFTVDLSNSFDSSTLVRNFPGCRGTSQLFMGSHLSYFIPDVRACEMSESK